jgi:hypothetical protein
MPGSEDRTPSDPDRPPVGRVGEAMQEAVDAEQHAAEEKPGATVRPEPGEHPAPGAVEEDVQAMQGEAPTG